MRSLRRSLWAAAVAVSIAPQAFGECMGFGTATTCTPTDYSAAYTTGGNNLVNLATQFQPPYSTFSSGYPAPSFGYGSSPYSPTYGAYPYGYGSYGASGGAFGSSPYSSSPYAYTGGHGGYGSGYGYVSPYGGQGYGGGYGYPATSFCSPYNYNVGAMYTGSSYGSYYGSSYPSSYSYPTYGGSISPNYGYSSYASPYSSSYPGLGTCGGSYGYPSYGSPYAGGIIYNSVNIFIDIDLSKTAQNTTRPMPTAPTWTSCGAAWDPCPSGPTDRDPVNDPPDTITPVPPSRYEEPRGTH